MSEREEFHRAASGALRLRRFNSHILSSDDNSLALKAGERAAQRYKLSGLPISYRVAGTCLPGKEMGPG